VKGIFFSHSVLPDFRESIAFWNVARLRSFVTQHVDGESGALVVWY